MNKDQKIASICLISLVLILLFLTSCKTKVIQVPIEIVKTEYKDRLQKDSIYINDSVFVKMQGDTIWMERYKTIYKEKVVRDTINQTEIKEIPYEVQLPPIEKKIYPKWLIILACVGCASLGYGLYRFIRR